MTIRARIRAAARAIGVDIRRLPRSELYRDSFSLQRHLAGGEVGTILDVGANVGATYLGYREMFPNSVIHAFEAIPELVEAKLRAYQLGDASLILNNVAVSAENGTATFHVNRGIGQGSLLATDAAAGQYVDLGPLETVREITVPTVRLEDYCRDKNIEGIDILKMDIQGGELKALQGAGALLDQGRIRLIYCEVMFVPQYASQPSFCDLWQYVSARGYVLYGLYNLSPGTVKTGVLSFADAIFLSPAQFASLG